MPSRSSCEAPGPNAGPGALFDRVEKILNRFEQQAGGSGSATIVGFSNDFENSMGSIGRKR